MIKINEVWKKEKATKAEKEINSKGVKRMVKRNTNGKKRRKGRIINKAKGEEIKRKGEIK